MNILQTWFALEQHHQHMSPLPEHIPYTVRGQPRLIQALAKTQLSGYLYYEYGSEWI